jgi:tetratricopeptide (TPR) repeat protein
VKAADRVQLWSETYDRSLDDIFAVQDDIAESVVKELRTTLFGQAPDSDASGRAQADVAVAAKGYGNNPEAHRLYLHGKYFLERLTEEDTAKGLQYLQEAVALDSAHAAAWSEISRAHANAGGYGWEPVVDAYRKARAAAERALELAPDLTAAHVRMSGIQRAHDLDWKAAEASVRRALALAPGDADALRSAGILAQGLGRLEEAEGYLRRATELDPLHSGGYTTLAMLYRSMGRLTDAERAYRKALELSPQRIASRFVLAIVLADQGRDAEALAEVNREPAEWARLTGLAYVHSKGGRKPESDVALAELEAKHATDSAYQIAAVRCTRGELDLAFAWLERAVADHDTGAAQMKTEPVFRPLHGDPRWDALLVKIGLGD